MFACDLFVSLLFFPKLNLRISPVCPCISMSVCESLWGQISETGRRDVCLSVHLFGVRSQKPFVGMYVCLCVSLGSDLRNRSSGCMSFCASLCGGLGYNPIFVKNILAPKI